jgi:ligand-binding sensor domain-containing protein/DNA-binding CsgD family transcriptional regulator
MSRIIFYRAILIAGIISFSAVRFVLGITHNQELSLFLINDFEIRNQNWSISQNPATHILYFANSEGLYEYNGISWRTHSSPDNFPVRSVMAHPNGNIFTGSFEEFGYWSYNNQHQLRYHSLTGLTDIEKNDEIWKIYQNDGKIFFQSFTSIYIYDFESISKVMAPFAMLFLHKLGDRFVAQVIDNGLYWFDNNEFIAIPGSRIFSDKKVHAIIPYSDNKWMICTDNAGLYLFDGTDFTRFESEASEFLINYTCNTAAQLSDTTLAFGSILNGVIITDTKGNIQRNYNTTNGLRNNTVLSFFVDQDNGLWAGLDEGVIYIDPASPFNHYRSTNGTLGTIYALLEHNNQLYIGTNHGLFIADIRERSGVYSFRNIRFVPESHGQVWTLEKFDNQILVGHNNGNFLIRNERLQKISDVTGGWAMIEFGDLVAGGTYTGIVFFEKGNNGLWRFRNKVQGFNEPVRYLETDYMGYLWASHHQRGIYRMELDDDLLSVTNIVYIPEIGGQSYNLKVFKVNNRVLFTNGKKIYTYDFVRNEIVSLNTLMETLGDFSMATQIIHHKRNEYWFIARDKIGLFDISLDLIATKQYEIIQEDLNFPQRNIQFVNLDDNTILIPNPFSFDAYNISLGKKQTNISRLTIDKIIFQGKRDSIIWRDFVNPAKTPWHTNNITAFFSDPSLFGQTLKRFEYRIREIDPSWQITTTDHLTLLNLKHGKYTLEIRREDGPVTSFIFSIGKPWYYSYMAWALYSIAFLLLIWGLYEFYRFELNRHREIVSLEVRQNTLEKELDYKSYELMLTMRHLILKDDILTDLQKQIDAIKEQSSKYPVKYLRNMERIISQGLGTQNVEWENAMKNLKLSQQGFFKELKERYPNLTSNDLRLCSYLRLNFNSKEIAQLLNISTRSVEISRHRLRKKLKLKNNENLFDFLLGIESEISESAE